MDWYYNEERETILSDDKGYALDYTGKLFSYDTKDWEYRDCNIIKTTKEQAFNNLLKNFELVCEAKEFKLQRKLEDERNENIKKLIQLKNSISEVV